MIPLAAQRNNSAVGWELGPTYARYMTANDVETELQDRWILADVDWVLQSPSSTVKVPAGQDYAIVKYIRRADDH